MSAIVKEVYDAFVEAGVSEEKSTLVAKAIADYDNRFSRIQSDTLDPEVDGRFGSFPTSSLEHASSEIIKNADKTHPDGQLFPHKLR
uniref:Uncharacterized protein n=1 Tax=Candidatus Kentrum sp. MB TaxID=2138164 RepID=A0A450X4W2_9GAMM|nr:MAG: hypothetical protein BECKMB1821G_GA0114241_100824 [Candidatus Kentron sp. MB]